MNIFECIDKHPGVTAFAVLCATAIVINICQGIFRIVNRICRARNIKNAGWPPEYLDADGDQVGH